MREETETGEGGGESSYCRFQTLHKLADVCWCERETEERENEREREAVLVFTAQEKQAGVC